MVGGVARGVYLSAAPNVGFRKPSISKIVVRRDFDRTALKISATRANSSRFDHNVTSSKTLYWPQRRNWEGLRLPKSKEALSSMQAFTELIGEPRLSRERELGDTIFVDNGIL